MNPVLEIKLLKEQLAAKEDMLNRTTNFLLDARKDLEKLNAKLTITNEELTASIRFAERIQQPLIPSEELLSTFFSESALHIHQKFHIGGDFIYCSSFQKICVFGLFDCTGHGVPGALLAIYGHSLLGEIINKLEETEPASILNLMGSRLYKSFSEASTLSSVETMDGILCRFENEERVLTYSSAKRIAFVLKGGNLEELKITKYSIGENDKNHYIDHKIKLAPGDKIILFSDGVTDQYDKADKNKFGRKGLKKIIEQNLKLGSKNLATALQSALSEWQGGNEQTDDISFLIIDI